MKRIQAPHRLRGPLGDHRGDPLGGVGGHVGQLLGPLFTQGVEERPHHLLVTALAGPYQPARVMVASSVRASYGGSDSLPAT